MSLKPIDLQTLFSHLNQVGKEQAVQKNAAMMQQAATANELVEETQQKDESVNQMEETEDGPDKVDDESGETPAGRRELKKRDQKKKEDKKYFKDPELGKHIDLEG